MRVLIVVAICIFLSGCWGLPFFSGSKKASSLVEEEVVEYSTNVSVSKLWKAAVVEFRTISIMEADEENFYLKGLEDDVFIEFKAQPKDERHASFTVKAATLDGQLKYEVAKRFAKRIYGRAKSLWFSLQ